MKGSRGERRLSAACRAIGPVAAKGAPHNMLGRCASRVRSSAHKTSTPSAWCSETDFVTALPKKVARPRPQRRHVFAESHRGIINNAVPPT